jgi:hypothetical protein
VSRTHRVAGVVGALVAASLFEWLVTGVALPGVIPVFGLVGCVVIIVVSKRLGKLFIQRPDPSITRGADEPAGEAHRA